MKYFGGCDAGSTYTKCVILDEKGKIVASVTSRSRSNPVLSAQAALEEAVTQVHDLKSSKDLAYLIGTGYGRNKVPFAEENISEISCHAMVLKELLLKKVKSRLWNSKNVFLSLMIIKVSILNIMKTTL